MNKREFVAGGMAAVATAPALAQPAGTPPPAGTLQALLTRTRRLPDLAERASADTFAAYIGQRFEIEQGPDAGHSLVLAAVGRITRCSRTEQFDVTFASERVPEAGDGVRLLAHSTGQRLALHLERGPGGYTARFNLLA